MGFDLAGAWAKCRNDVGIFPRILAEMQLRQ